MRSLRAQGRSVLGLDIKPSPFTARVGSVADREFVRAAMARVVAIVHAATLHKPHVATHSGQAFIDTNITGTLVLLEEAVSAGVQSFVFTSTTSAFGLPSRPASDAPATWVTEALPSLAKNIYGVTKVAAENLCELFFRRHRIPVVILRTSRFFPEVDDEESIRGEYELANAQANELLFRRVDMEDVVRAHLLAIAKAPSIGFGRYIISATSPFTRDDLTALGRDAPSVVQRLFPDCAALYAARGWKLFPAIDRVYVSELAARELGWRPRCGFGHVLECLRTGTDFRSPLALEVGSKGYHAAVFAQGPYPVAS